VDRRVYIPTGLGATAACYGAFLRDTSPRDFVTRGSAGFTHVRAQFANVCRETRLAHHKSGAGLAYLGAVFRRLYGLGVYATASLQRHTGFLALSTSIDALLRFPRSRLGH
jgi:hypothetical protein